MRRHGGGYRPEPEAKPPKRRRSNRNRSNIAQCRCLRNHAETLGGGACCKDSLRMQGECSSEKWCNEALPQLMGCLDPTMATRTHNESGEQSKLNDQAVQARRRVASHAKRRREMCRAIRQFAAETPMSLAKSRTTMAAMKRRSRGGGGLVGAGNGCVAMLVGYFNLG